MDTRDPADRPYVADMIRRLLGQHLKDAGAFMHAPLDSPRAEFTPYSERGRSDAGQTEGQFPWREDKHLSPDRRG